MSRRKYLFLISIVILISIFLIYYFLKTEKKSKDLILYGNVDVRQVDIGFRVSGRVASLFFEEGDCVQKGVLLACLDPSPYDSEIKSTEATLESTQISLSNAEKIFKRRKELIDVGGVSLEDMQDAETEQNNLKAKLLENEANLQIAKDNLSFTYAYAPNDAIILTRIREPGSIVREADPIYTLSIISPVWVRAFVNEPNLGNVYFGMPAEIHTDKEGGVVYRGYVGFISPVSEFTPKTVETTELRTDLVYRLRIYVENPDFSLKQGMPVTVRLKHERE